jgi:hypothetical protein
LPIIQFFLIPNLFFWINAGAIDPWLYTGYFLSFPHHLAEFGGTYYGSRLPWILPGYAIYSFLPSLPASYFLHFGFYYTLLLTSYLLIKRATDKRTGLLAALIIAWSPGMLKAMSSDYVDGAGIVYILLTLYAIERALTGASCRKWMVLSGVAFACTVYTNLFLVILCPVYALHYWMRNRRERNHTILSSCIYACAGILLITVAFGAINKAFGGDFLFFMPSVHFALGFKVTASPWKPPNHEWMLGAYWLVTPIIALLGAITSCFRQRANLLKLNVDSALASQIDCIVAYILMILYNAVSGGAIFYFHYYASYLIPFGLIALSLQISSVINRITKLEYFIVFFTFLVILMYPYISNIDIPQDNMRILIALCTGIIAITSLTLLKRPLVGIAIFVICLSINYTYTMFPYARDYEDDTFSDPRSVYNAVCETHGLVKRLVKGHKAYFWYNHDIKSPEGDFFRGVASTYLWGYRLISEEYPAIKEEQAKTLTDSAKIILLQKEGNMEIELRQALAKIAMEPQHFQREAVKLGGISFQLAVFDSQLNPDLSDNPPKSGLEQVLLVLNQDSQILSLQRNIYGKLTDPSKQPLSHQEGKLRFCPTTDKDHLATPFSTIESNGEVGPRWLHLQLEMQDSVAPEQKTAIVVQDQKFNNLLTLTSPFPQQNIEKYIAIAPDVSSVRVIITGKSNDECALPDKVVLKYIR